MSHSSGVRGPGSLEVFAHAKGRQKTSLCRVEHDAPNLQPEQILDRLRLFLSGLGVTVLWEVSSGEGGGSKRPLH